MRNVVLKTIWIAGLAYCLFFVAESPTAEEAKNLTSPIPEELSEHRAPVDPKAPWRLLYEIYGSEIGAKPFNSVDAPVLDLLSAKQIKPTALCSDPVFLRRIYLDLTGTLPTPEAAKRFLEDITADKRARLIDELLETPEFTEYWTLKWADMLRVKAEFPINLWPNGAMVYQRWIRDSIRQNKPLNIFVRELLLGTGSNFRSPPSNFYRAVSNKDPETIAQAVALSLFGVRFENWPEDKQKQLGVFFSRIAYKKSAEWKEEIVYWDDRPLDDPNIVFPDGKTARIEAGQDIREVFADWFLTSENPWFAKNLVNRTWFWLFGRGIVHEPDDFRPDNIANPALLDLLASEFVKSNYDFKQLIRLIVGSRTYQQSSIARSDNSDAERFFACYSVRQVDAEVLQDTFRRILHANIGYASDVPEPFTHIPVWQRTISLADGSITSPFLEIFGRPPRDSGLLSERNSNPTAAQRMFLINSSEMVQWIDQTWRLQNAANAFVASEKPAERRSRMLDYVWLTILSRYPIKEEKLAALALYNEKERNHRALFQDIVWSLINSKEFLCRH